MRLILLALALLCCLAASPAAVADSGERLWPLFVDSGDGALPLKQILAAVRGSFPGEVLDASLFESDGTMFYRIKILGPDNRVVELIVNAQTAEVVSQR
jgi:uncharacterized membrane protein YkoI